MLTRVFISNWLLALFAAVLPGWAEELTYEKFEELLTQLPPTNDKLWRTIPWRIALLDAQRTAVEEKKPIFIWAMAGHPLGCT